MSEPQNGPVRILIHRYGGVVLAAVFLFVCLYLVSQANYLFFHTIVELFSIIIACTAFVLTWNGRNFLGNGSLLLIGISLLAVAGFDLLHTLSYSGMGVLPNEGANLPTQLWIAARFIQSFSLAIATLFLHRRIHPSLTLMLYAITSAALLFSIYPAGTFPASFVDGPSGGLTDFKIASEYTIILLLFIAGIQFYRHRRSFDREVWVLMTVAIILAIFSEFMFTLYMNVFDDANMAGHFLKIGSFYFLYRAIIETGFRRPQQVLYYELAESEKALRTSEAKERQRYNELQAIMDAVPAVVWISQDRNSIVVTGNRAAAELLHMRTYENLSLSAPRGEAPTHFKVLHNGRELAPDELPLQVTAVTGMPLRNYEESIVFDTGDVIHLLGNVTPLFDENGEPAGAVGAFIDISARKRAEKEIQEYASRLELSNRELQEFAFVASHDLQEPLRKIQAFSDRVKVHLEGQVDSETADYLERMSSASKRMRAMIEDLLSLSRITSRGQPFAPVNMEEVAIEVISDLDDQIRRTNGQVEIAHLPVVDADHTQMHQLILNLVNNGLKFHREGVPPVIKLYGHCSDDGSNNCIFIEDNGIGFDEKYTDRIFQPFQRLHGMGKYEGSGIGLAVCRKIAERHGGSVTAKSVIGQGSTFIINLPARIPRRSEQP